MLTDLWAYDVACLHLLLLPKPAASQKLWPNSNLTCPGRKPSHDLFISGRVLCTSGYAKVPNTLSDGKAHCIFCLSPFYRGGRGACGAGAVDRAGACDILMFHSRISAFQTEEPRFSKKGSSHKAPKPVFEYLDSYQKAQNNWQLS